MQKPTPQILAQALEMAAACYGTTAAAIRAQSRIPANSSARIVYYALSRSAGFTFQEIAEHIDRSANLVCRAYNSIEGHPSQRIENPRTSAIRRNVDSLLPKLREFMKLSPVQMTELQRLQEAIPNEVSRVLDVLIADVKADRTLTTLDSLIDESNEAYGETVTMLYNVDSNTASPELKERSKLRAITYARKSIASLFRLIVKVS